MEPLAETLNAQGNAFAARTRLEEAAASYGKAAELDPTVIVGPGF